MLNGSNNKYSCLGDAELRELAICLTRARRWDALRDILLDFDFIEECCFRDLLSSLQIDFDRAVRLHPDCRPRRAAADRRRNQLSKYVRQLVQLAEYWYDQICAQPETRGENAREPGLLAPSDVPGANTLEDTPISGVAEFLSRETAVLQRNRRQRGFARQHAYNLGYIDEDALECQSPLPPMFLAERPGQCDAPERIITREFPVRCSHGEQLSLTPDGRSLLAIDDQQVARLFDIESGAEAFSLSLPPGERYCCTISANGQAMATPDGEGAVSVWSTLSLEKLYTVPSKHGSLKSVRLSADGRLLLTCCTRQLALWDITRGRRLRVHDNDRPSEYVAAAMTNDGRAVVAVSLHQASAGVFKGALQFWDTVKDTIVVDCSYRMVRYPRGVALSATGDVVVVAGLDEIQAWVDREALCSRPKQAFTSGTGGSEGGVLPVLKHGSNGIDIDAVGGCAVAPGSDGLLYYFDPSQPEQINAIQTGLSGAYCCRVSANARLVVIGGPEGTELLNLPGPNAEAIKAKEPLACVHYNPVRRSVMSVDVDGRVRLEGGDREPIRDSGRCHPPLVYYPLTFRENRLLQVFDLDGSAEIWDTTTGERLWHDAIECDARISPDDQRVIGLTISQRLRVHRLGSDSAPIHPAMASKVKWFDVLPSGRIAVTAWPGGWHLWDLVEERCLRTGVGLEGATTFSLSQDGRHLCSAANDGRAAVTDLDTGTRVQTLMGKRGWFEHHEFHPSGQYLFATSRDSRGSLWRLRDGQLLWRSRGSGHLRIMNAAHPHWTVEDCRNGIRLWSLGRKSPVAALDCATEVRCTSGVTPGGFIAIGRPEGGHRLYRLRGYELGPPVATSFWLWDYQRSAWSRDLRALCPWCRALSVVDCTTSRSSESQLSGYQVAQRNWPEHQLRHHLCTHCGNSVFLTNVVLDEKKWLTDPRKRSRPIIAQADRFRQAAVIDAVVEDALRRRPVSTDRCATCRRRRTSIACENGAALCTTCAWEITLALAHDEQVVRWSCGDLQPALALRRGWAKCVAALCQVEATTSILCSEMPIEHALATRRSLADLLGCVDPHPFAGKVRDLACHLARALGETMRDAVIQTIAPHPHQLMLNGIRFLAHIDPESTDCQGWLARASEDDRITVRWHAFHILNSLSARWASPLRRTLRKEFGHVRWLAQGLHLDCQGDWAAYVSKTRGISRLLGPDYAGEVHRLKRLFRIDS
jgi:WD40 repeat protein